MAQNNSFKNSTILVNSNLIGIRNRTGQAGAQLNYALRSTWGIGDRLRGVMGKYYAEYDSARGTDLVNLGDGTESLPNLSLAQQVENQPLVLTELPTNDGTVKYLIELDNAAWNALAFENTSRDLLRQNIQEEGVNEGDPMWEDFLKEGIPAANLSDPPAATNVPPVFDTSAPFSDLTSFFYRASNDDAIRKKSGLTVKVEPVYNFYADTTPTYETISLQASEPMLPNFYCLESEIRNTGSTFNSADYFDQITLDGKLQDVNIDNDAEPDPWFQQVAGPSPGYTESTTTQFYTLYSKGLNILKGRNEIEGLKGIFNAKFKNMVILNSDLAAMSEFVIRDDETSGLRNMAFYNKITIGKDEDNVADPSDLFNNSSFFSLLMADPDFEQSHGFMDILQLYIIKNILTSPGTSTSFKTKRITKGSDTDPTTYNLNLGTESIPLYFDMGAFLNDIRSPGSTDTINKIITRINTNTTTDDNFILIRNYNSESSLLMASNVATDNFLLLNEDERVNYPVRNFDKILENKGCYSEPIMYKIDKYVLTPSLERPAAGATPVQTFFIGKSFENKEINYIDSQVKYGVRYYYDIQQVRMVFGNTYSYKDLKVFFSAVAGYGRAVGNALGFYKETQPQIKLDDYISEQVKEYTSSDSDPPESAVVISGTGNEVSSLNSYYIFKAANFNSFVAGPSRTTFEEVFTTGTQYVHKNPFMDNAPEEDRDILRNINVQIKEGFGFNGNQSGGAVGGALNIFVTTVGEPPPQPGPPGGPPFSGMTAEASPLPAGASSGMTAQTSPVASSPGGGSPTYETAPDYGTPVDGTGPLDPSLLNKLFGGN